MKTPGSAFAVQFTVFSSTGALVDADSLPTGTVVHNGVDDGSPAVTITHISTGLYKATGTVPTTYIPGDEVQIRVNATVSGVTSAVELGNWTLDFPIFVAGSVTVATSATALTISIPSTTWAAADLLGRYVRTVPTTGLPPEEAPIVTATLVTSTTFAVTFSSGLFTTVPTVGTQILVG